MKENLQDNNPTFSPRSSKSARKSNFKSEPIFYANSRDDFEHRLKH